MADFKIVFAVVERGRTRHWLRVGLAFVNADGSLNVKLDAFPVSGQLQIRDQSPPLQAKTDDSNPPSASAPATKRTAPLRGKRSS
jgi:hypothetical protein